MPHRRGRLAPTPTGYLHAGHARTFALAAERAGPAGLVLRIEDLDGPRCRPEYTAAALEDLRWLGLHWTEGPDVGGPFGPYVQSERAVWYLEIWRRLEAAGAIYPSPHSRRDVEQAATAPHDETVPGLDAGRIGQAASLPPRASSEATSAERSTPAETATSAALQETSPLTQPVAAGLQPAETGPHPAGRANSNQPTIGQAASLPPRASSEATSAEQSTPAGTSLAANHFASAEPVFPPALRPARWDRAAAPGGVPWRFRVPDGRVIEFHDGLCGPIRLTAGVDFGDFVVWRRDDLAAYELAVVADDHAMEIEEVVRGRDLLVSTARQLLLYEALGWQPPAFAHAPLVCNAAGQRLAKRTAGLAIRDLRAAGWSPADVLTRPLP